MAKIEDKPLADALKVAMNHQHPARTCARCKHFKETDCGGGMDALRSHCTLTPVTIVYVDSQDVCDHFTLKAGR